MSLVAVTYHSKEFSTILFWKFWLFLFWLLEILISIIIELALVLRLKYVKISYVDYS